MISRVKHVGARQLDAALPNLPFEVWLQQVAGKNGRISWAANDCGQGGQVDISLAYPVCVEANVDLAPGEIVVTILAGNLSDGVPDVPGFLFAEIQGLGPSVEVRTLSNLPNALRRARAIADTLSHVPISPIDSVGAIEYLRRLPARRLNSALPDSAFGGWFAALAGSGAAVVWKLDGCDHVRAGMTLDDRGHDEWACVVAQFENAFENVTVETRVGTFRRGLFGTPIAQGAQVFNKRVGQVSIRRVALPNLPALLREIRQ